MPSTTTKGVPYPLGTDAAADLDTIIQSLADWVEANPGVALLTTTERDALSGVDLWTGRVIYNTTLARLQQYDGVSWVSASVVENNAITNAAIRDSAALSVIGRSASSAGDPSDISAGTDGHVLRRSGTTLGFGTVVTAGIADSAITGTKMGSSYGCKVVDTTMTLAAFASSTAVYNSETFDPNSFHAASSSNIVVPAGGSGMYALRVKLTTSSGSVSSSTIEVNGSFETFETSYVTELTAGDSITVDVTAGSGGWTGSITVSLVRIGILS